MVSNDGGDSYVIGMVNVYLLLVYDMVKVLDENLVVDFIDWDFVCE